MQVPRGPVWRWRLRAALLAAAVGSASPLLAADNTCLQLTEEEGLQPLPGCTLAQDRVQLDAATLARLDFDTHGLSALYAGNSFHYVTRSGRSLPVITWDNGPDYVEEGLLRGRVGTRIGYFDAALEPAFAATFDFGWPFRDGVAEVCNGCRRGPSDAHGHAPMVGGERFRIDRRGQRLADTDVP